MRTFLAEQEDLSFGTSCLQIFLSPLVWALLITSWVTTVGAGGTGILGGIYSLAILIPSIAVGIRRLHDTDRSGWWILIGLIPLIGAIVLIVFYVQEGTPGTNEYGPNPTEVSADDISSHLVD